MKANDVKALTNDHVTPYLAGNEDLALAGKVSTTSIDFFTWQIKSLESVVEERIELRDPYNKLLTEHGIGKILGLTIMLGDSPCQSICRRWKFCIALSKGFDRLDPQGEAKRAKGIGNRKCGKKYLDWAFSEAAELARRFDKDA